MTLNQLLTFLFNFFPWGFTKLAILILIGLYIIFAAIIVRQETLMSKVVEIPFSPILRVTAISHFIASVVIFLLAFILL